MKLTTKKRLSIYTKMYEFMVKYKSIINRTRFFGLCRVFAKSCEGDFYIEDLEELCLFDCRGIEKYDYNGVGTQFWWNIYYDPKLAYNERLLALSFAISMCEIELENNPS